MGFCSLHLSKLVMYLSYRSKILFCFGDYNVELLHMDKDSFVLRINRIKDSFGDLKLFSKYLDLSELDPSHELYSEDNKKAIGKAKFESCPKNELAEAVFLESKTYIIKKLSNSIKSKHEGVQTQFKNTFEDLKKCLEQKTERNVELIFLKTKKHEFLMVKEPQIALKKVDYKR